MKQDLTEMVFILDRSGSMAGLEKDTIGGFNSMIDKQKDLDGDAIVSTVLFDNHFEVIHNRVNLKDISHLTHKDYYVRGSTALLDAIGRSIRKIRTIYAETLREDRPDKVMFVITTDGMENASRQFSYHDIQHMIQDVKEKYGWEFLFLGANIDAVGEARRFGIDADRAVRYHADKVGTQVNYEAINDAVSSYRMNKAISKEWKQKVEDDFEKRK